MKSDGVNRAGVLFGRDLINAAEQRAQIAQIEKYNVAVNTFRNKYGGLPGDLLAKDAIAFGITNNINFTGGPEAGDGDGTITATWPGGTFLYGETLIFWLELSAASLIEGSYLTNLATDGKIPAASPPAAISSYIPPAKLGRGNYVMVGPDFNANTNNFFVSAVTAISASGFQTFSNNIKAIEAYNMDKKIDDGMPVTGAVRAIDTVLNWNTQYTLSIYAANATLPNCVTATPTYAVTVSAPGCSLVFRMN